MQIFKRIFDFYIFSNIHVALAAFCLAKLTLLTYAIDQNLIPFFVFFSTITGYNFIRLYKIDNIQDWFFIIIKANRKVIVALTIVSGIFVTYLGFLLNTKALVALIPFGLFTLFYAIPIPMKKEKKVTLRSLAYFKMFLIAISWAGVTVLIPLINYDIVFDKDVAFVFLQRFLFAVVVVIPFDIRDMNFDNEQLKTLPQFIGVQKSKILGLFTLMLFLGLEFLKNPVEPQQLRVHFFIALVTLFFLFKANVIQHKYYSAFFVESIPMVWLGVFVFLNSS